jgi:hypothetical protein
MGVSDRVAIGYPIVAPTRGAPTVNGGKTSPAPNLNHPQNPTQSTSDKKHPDLSDKLLSGGEYSTSWYSNKALVLSGFPKHTCG